MEERAPGSCVLIRFVFPDTEENASLHGSCACVCVSQTLVTYRWSAWDAYNYAGTVAIYHRYCPAPRLSEGHTTGQTRVFFFPQQKTCPVIRSWVDIPSEGDPPDPFHCNALRIMCSQSGATSLTRCVQFPRMQSKLAWVQVYREGFGRRRQFQLQARSH